MCSAIVPGAGIIGKALNPDGVSKQEHTQLVGCDICELCTHVQCVQRLARFII